MKLFLKSIMLSAALVTSGAMAAEKITWVLPYGPGGGTDQVIQQLKPLLEQQGHDVEVKYLKSCAQALEILHRNEPNTIFNASSNVFEPGRPDAQCVMDAKTDGIVLFKGLNINPFYLCTAPGKQMGLLGLSTGEKKVGVVAEEQLLKYVSYVLTNLKKDNNVKVIPYRGGGQVVRAAKAGDIDLWFGASQINVFNKNEITCFGSSIKNDTRGYSFIGDITKQGNSFIEFPFINLLWVKEGLVTPDVAASFNTAVNSKEFKDYLVKTKKAIPPTNNVELMDQLLELNEKFESMPSVK